MHCQIYFTTEYLSLLSRSRPTARLVDLSRADAKAVAVAKDKRLLVLDAPLPRPVNLMEEMAAQIREELKFHKL